MCVGRYAEMIELSEAKRNHFEMPATMGPVLCIPAECDTTPRFNNPNYTNNDVAFRWNAYLSHIICRHFEKIPFRFAPLHLFCMPAYTHLIPNGISSHLLRDNLYIIS